MTQDERNTLIFRIAGLALVFRGIAPLASHPGLLHSLASAAARPGGSGAPVLGQLWPSPVLVATCTQALCGIVMVLASRPMGRLLAGRQCRRACSWREDAVGVGLILVGCHLLAGAAGSLAVVALVAEAAGFIVPVLSVPVAAGLALVAWGRRAAGLLERQGLRSEGQHLTTAQALSAGLSLLGVLYGARYGTTASAAGLRPGLFLFRSDVLVSAAIGLGLAAGAVLGAGPLGRLLAQRATEAAGAARKLARMPPATWVLVALQAGVLYVLLEALSVVVERPPPGWSGVSDASRWAATYAQLTVLAVVLALAARLLVPAVVPVIWREPSPGAHDQRDASVLALEAAMTVLLLAYVCRLLVAFASGASARVGLPLVVVGGAVAPVLLGFRGDIARSLVGAATGASRRADRRDRAALLCPCLVLLGFALFLHHTPGPIAWAVQKTRGAGSAAFPGLPVSPLWLVPQAALGPVLVLAGRPLSRLLAHGPLLPLILADRHPRS